MFFLLFALIAVSCNLFNADTQHVVVQGSTLSEVQEKISQYLDAVEDNKKLVMEESKKSLQDQPGIDHEELAISKATVPPKPKEFGLVIDGKALLFALKPEASKVQFLLLH